MENLDEDTENYSAMKFSEIDLKTQIIDRLHEQGFEELTLIQEKCIPDISNGKDVVGQAETGSGKTLAFGLPILNNIKPGHGIQALVITPTRELCVQVKDEFVKYGKKLKIKTISIYGGVKIEPQIQNLRSADIVIGTPGRILDHTRRNTIDFSNVGYFVLDEIDKMFEMGFIEDVEKIIDEIPKERQTLMFSATISPDIYDLIQKHSNDPLIVQTNAFVDSSKLRQIYYDISDRNDKFSILVHLLRRNKKGLSIVFCATRREADLLERNLRNLKIHVSAIHGGMKQGRRMKNLNALKDQKARVLVATDVAARGLDIKNVKNIYNYDVPQTVKDYTHRIGRTARAGEEGIAVTLLTERDHDNFRRVQKGDEHQIDEIELPDFKRIPFYRKFERRPQVNKDGKNKNFKRKSGNQNNGGRKKTYGKKPRHSGRSRNYRKSKRK